MLEAFKQLGLSDKTLEALEKKWFETPSPIQLAVIPLLLGNTKNIIGQAQTGTGKTAAFGLPLIEKIKPIGHVQAIILVPTRELAVQVAEEISSLQTTKTLQITPIYGGQSYDIQNRLLKKWTDIVVGTPGRVIDHISRKTLKIEDISYFILDEADEMLNMGFIDDIEDIFKHTNKDKRVLLFSATMPKEILNVARKYMGEYELVSIKKDQLTTPQTEQIYFEVNERDKMEALIRVIDMEEDFYGIVFCKTKMDVDHLTARLNEKWHFVQALHGDVQQKQRENILKLFKAKKTKIIIATDVAARGIDVNDISHVINYSLPQDPESYIHRIGRTGRAGKTGIAITFVTASEFRKLVYFQRATQTTIKKWEIPAITDIIKTKKNKFQQNLNAIVENEGYKSTLEFAQQLLQDKSPEHVVAALIKIAYENEFNEHNYKSLDKVQMGSSNNGM